MISAPAALTADHDVSQFDCGNDLLNEWLIKRATKNQISGASRCFVICRANRVVGYYALASGSVERASSPRAIARNMPEPVPVVVLGRLAIEHSIQGQRLGSGLLRDALLRTLNVAKQVGVRGILVHAISEPARRFYLSYGFQESPIDRMTLMLSIRQIQGML